MFAHCALRESFRPKQLGASNTPPLFASPRYLERFFCGLAFALPENVVIIGHAPESLLPVTRGVSVTVP